MRPQAQRPYIPRRPLRPRPAPTLSAAVHRGLHGARTQQQGVSLMELLLVAGVIAAGTAIVFNVYQNVNAASKVDAEGESLRALTKNILDSYSASADYSSLTTERAIEDGLFPNTMMSDGTGEPVSTWGKPVRVVATDINRDGANLENWGFVIAYDDVPSKACVDLISQAGPEFNDIRVEGTSIGVGANLNVTQMGQLCNRATGADVQFVFERRALQNEGGALTLCSDSLPTDAETQVVACPAGQYGLVNQSRSAFCVSSYGSFQWTPWATTSQTCSPCPAPESRVNTRTVACPTGQNGVWTQSRNETRSANCPLPGPNGPSELTTWNSWTATTSWATVTNTCANICVLPSPSSETRWVGQSATCPTGQAGHNTWEREERRLASCPPLAPGYTVPVGNYSWSTWTATGTVRNQDNTCATCPTPQSQNLSCPSGQVGNIAQNRTYNCTGEGSWGAWTTTSNTCVACPSPESQALACPSGQVGTISQTRTYNCSGQGSWGAWTTTSNTCTACPSPESRTLDCPSGQYGAIQQSRSFTCSGQGTWGSWTTTSNTCSACPANTTATETQWVASSANCPVSQFGSNTWERQQTRNRSVTYSCPVGTRTLPGPTYGTWSAWADTGTTRNVVNTCAGCPAPATQTEGQWVASSATCTAGQYGTNTWERYQTRTRSVTYSCPAGTSTLPPATYGTWSAWGDTGTTRNVVNTCTSCPAPSTQTNKQWVASSAACPSGQVGSNTWEREQSQSRSVTYTCPAGTTALPSPVYGTWGAWTNTGATRNVVNTCTTCPAPAVETQTLSCPSFQTGSITQQRTRPYNCSGTGSWGSWGAWTTTSNTCALPACTGTLQSNGNNYMARYPDLAAAFYGGWGQDYNQVYAHWYNNGYYEGRQSCWGAPCVLPSPSTQTEYREQSELRQFACPAGQYGPNPGIDEWRTLYQSRSRTASCPSPTTPYTWSAYSAWSTYNTSAWTRTANHCNNCPAPFGQNEYQFVSRSAGCPAGQTGSQTWQAQQVRSRTGSYNCPAGTTSIPGATYTAWSAWADTGATQNYNSTCTPSCVAPAPSYNYDYNWNTCGVGKVVEYGERRQLVTWTCPGPTSTAGAWEVIRYPRCCSTKSCQIQ